MKRIYLIIFCLIGLTLPLSAQVVRREVAPEIDYSLTPRQYNIAKITIDGVKNYDDRLLIGLSGLAEGQNIEIPGEEITKAVKRYWRNHASRKSTSTASEKVSAMT